MITHVTRLIDYQYMLPILNEREITEKPFFTWSFFKNNKKKINDDCLGNLVARPGEVKL